MNEVESDHSANHRVSSTARAHLCALAEASRFSGTAGAVAARAYCSAALQRLGFRLTERPFGYSAAVAAYGTPLGGLIMLGVVAGAASLSLGGLSVAALLVLLIGVALLAIGGRWLARDGILRFPFMRRTGINLEALCGSGAPSVWLVAHLDSKSQPVPLAARAAGIVLLGIAWLAAVLLAVDALMGHSPRRAWSYVIAAGVVGALPVLGSVVGRNSAGAVDNASGVATVLGAAELLGAQAGVGVLITDAEELGLAGARAWCTTRSPGIALNCDGVDDSGLLTLMWTRPRSSRVESALVDAAGEPMRVIPLVPGVLVDSLAFSDAGWEAVTLSRGSLATLRRIHTRRDDLDHLRGDGLEVAAGTLARAASALTEKR
jgi:hypothetical protein